MTNALRPSELFAFRWRRFDRKAATLTVAETVYKGNIRDWGKTRKSLAVIHIPRELANDLQAWRLVCEQRAQVGTKNDDSKSASIAGRLHLRQRGWRLSRQRQRSQAGAAQTRSRPELAQADVPGHLQNDCNTGTEEGALKDVQGVLRHSRSATTMDVYMQEIPESVQSTINSISRELRISSDATRQKRKKSAAAGAVVVSSRILQNAWCRL